MEINVGVISLGCSKNLVDTEVILGNLSRMGYKITNKVENADVLIINTCGFIDKAKQESIETILEMAEYRMKGKCRALLVIGCLAERYKDDIIKEIPEVDAVLGVNNYPQITEVLKDLLRLNSTNCCIYTEDYAHRLRSTPPHMAYLKIAEGCDNHCTYCVIPSIRGRYRSRKMESILEEAGYLGSQGVKELIVIAQDTTRYGMDIYGKAMLGELLKKLCKVEGIKWVRLMYAYPDSITDELIEVMAGEQKICKYIDLPIQHISSSILKAMGRRGTSSRVKETIAKLRRAMPEVAIRTSLIVGFPGETEHEFEELYKFVEEIRFDRLGVFAYSKEEGTPAAKLQKQIPASIKKSRQSKVMRLQKQISKEINQSFIGKELDVLIEGETCNGGYFGRTHRDAPEIDGIIYVKSKRILKEGSMEKVKIKKASQYDLSGGVS